MKIIDTNALAVLVLGIMDPEIIDSQPRTSIYEKSDFQALLSIIGDLKTLIILPNVWTELDNLLNNFQGQRKNIYVNYLIELTKITTEQFLPTAKGVNSSTFYDLGLTDSLILQYAKKCKLLITSDSKLSNYAIMV